MSDEVKELISKAKSLVNEATGFLEHAQIRTHGVTNINCLNRRINEAKSAIAAAERRAEAHLIVSIRLTCRNCGAQRKYEWDGKNPIITEGHDCEPRSSNAPAQQPTERPPTKPPVREWFTRLQRELGEDPKP